MFLLHIYMFVRVYTESLLILVVDSARCPPPAEASGCAETPLDLCQRLERLEPLGAVFSPFPMRFRLFFERFGAFWHGFPLETGPRRPFLVVDESSRGAPPRA